MNTMSLINMVNFDFSAIDNNTWIIAFVGYLIVFSALVLLYFVFFGLSKILKIRLKRNFKLKKGSKAEEIDLDEDIPGEVNAAISLALYMHFNEFHDEESNVMTIKQVSRRYSPWSSKIYAVRNQFNRS